MHYSQDIVGTESHLLNKCAVSVTNVLLFNQFLTLQSGQKHHMQHLGVMCKYYIKVRNTIRSCYMSA